MLPALLRRVTRKTNSNLYKTVAGTRASVSRGGGGVVNESFKGTSVPGAAYFSLMAKLRPMKTVTEGKQCRLQNQTLPPWSVVSSRNYSGVGPGNGKGDDYSGEYHRSKPGRIEEDASEVEKGSWRPRSTHWVEELSPGVQSPFRKRRTVDPKVQDESEEQPGCPAETRNCPGIQRTSKDTSNCAVCSDRKEEKPRRKVPGKSCKVEPSKDHKPSLSSLKHRLSKCQTVIRMEETCCDPESPPDPVDRSARKEERSVPVSRRSFRMRKSRPSGDWSKQRYHVRLRIFKSMDGRLDPCPPPVIELKKTPLESQDVRSVKAARMNDVDKAVLRKLSNPCPSRPCCGTGSGAGEKSYATKMKESLEQSRKPKCPVCQDCPIPVT